MKEKTGPGKKNKKHRPPSAEPQAVIGRDIGEEGEGIATLPSGLTVFVPGLLPGEEARIVLEKETPRFAVGNVHERTKASPDRVEPPCSIYGDCGGCQLQHWSTEAALAWKGKQVAEALRRIGGIETNVAPAKSLGVELGYRNRLILPVKGNSREVEVGFFRRGSHEVVPLSKCLVAQSPHEELLAAFRAWVSEGKVPIYVEKAHAGLLRHIAIRSNRKGEILVTLVVTKRDPLLYSFADVLFGNDKSGVGRFGVSGLFLNVNPERGNQVFGRENSHAAGSPELVETVGGLDFEIGPDTFFQLNTAAAEWMYERALSHLPEAPRRLFDLYCGVGTLSLLAARKFPGCRVTGIEAVPGSIRSAKRNAKRNGIGNADFLEGSAAGLFGAAMAEGDEADAVLVNPPRVGLEPDLCEALAEKGPPHLVYVSCKPGTLARDAKRLVAGGYRLESAEPLDMLPQTAHIETIAVFRR